MFNIDMLRLNGQVLSGIFIMAVSSAAAFSLTTAMRETMDIAFKNSGARYRILAHWISPLVLLTIVMIITLTTGVYIDPGVSHIA